MHKFYLCLLLLAAGCNRPHGAPSTESKRPEPLAERGFYGTITPHRATALHAPPNVFRMKGWNSRSTWIKLIDVVPDGTKVEAGKEVARFEFSNEEALPWIKKRITETQADLENARTRNAEESRQLGSSAAVKRLAREQAELDTGKAGLVSERDLALLGLAAARAKVEEESARELTSAASGRAAAELSLFDARADDWKNSIERYHAYERRTHLAAPHAGLVRYGYLNHARRKLQKPDEMPSGTPFVYIAEDELLSVEFFVPEHRIRGLAIGQKVNARLPDDERRVPATVREILPFPQEIGFLRGDDDLPDAREKAYAVVADFAEAPPFFSSGIEVRIEP
ncbi:MAG: HlyD family efflux transporter periplasmic adaptor subunit [Minicystis sp.]